MGKSKRYVDVNIFVYWLTGNPTFGPTAKEWVYKISKGTKSTFITGSITIYEVAIVLAGLLNKTLKDFGLIDIIISSIYSLAGLKIVEVTKQTFYEAKNLMEKYSLDYEDAIHLAIALREDADEIISNDKHFDRTPISRIF